MDPAGPGPYIGQVGDPQLVGPAATKRRLTRSGGCGAAGSGTVGAALLPADHALEAVLAHQPFDRAAGRDHTLTPQLAVDPPGSVGRNSAFSLRSWASSLFSAVVSRSGRSPWSASAWRTQSRRDSLWMPRSRATCATGRPEVLTSRTARSRNSSGYFRGAGIGPVFSHPPRRSRLASGPPQNPVQPSPAVQVDAGSQVIFRQLHHGALARSGRPGQDDHLTAVRGLPREGRLAPSATVSRSTSTPLSHVAPAGTRGTEWAPVIACGCRRRR